MLQSYRKCSPACGRYRGRGHKFETHVWSVVGLEPTTEQLIAMLDAGGHKRAGLAVVSVHAWCERMLERKVNEHAELGHRIQIEPVMDLAGYLLASNPTGLPENCKVFGGGWLADLQLLRHFRHRQWRFLV